MSDSKKTNLTPWLSILLIAAVVLAVTAFMGKGDLNKKLVEANAQIEQVKLDATYNLKAAEETKDKLINEGKTKIDELQSLIETNKKEATANMDDALKKLGEEKDKQIAELITQLENSKSEVNNNVESALKAITEEKDGKIAEISSLFETYKKEAEDKINGITAVFNEITEKYSNDYTSRAKDVINAIKEKLGPLGFNLN